MQKKLYSGQSDGKILIWDIFTSKGKEDGVLDFLKAQKKHDKENGQSDNSHSKEKKLKEKEDSKTGKKVSHDGVSCIKVLGKMQMIAAGYLNGCVLIWDLMLRDYRKFYTDQKMAIYQIAFDEIKKLIFTILILTDFP